MRCCYQPIGFQFGCYLPALYLGLNNSCCNVPTCCPQYNCNTNYPYQQCCPQYIRPCEPCCPPPCCEPCYPHPEPYFQQNNAFNTPCHQPCAQPCTPTPPCKPECKPACDCCDYGDHGDDIRYVGHRYTSN